MQRDPYDTHRERDREITRKKVGRVYFKPAKISIDGRHLAWIADRTRVKVEVEVDIQFKERKIARTKGENNKHTTLKNQAITVKHQQDRPQTDQQRERKMDSSPV